MRTLIAYLIAPVMAVTGRLFSRMHRVNDDLVYKFIDTVAANYLAIALNPLLAIGE
jgi:hypothetical protein